MKPIPNGHSVGKQMRPCLQSWPQSHSRLWLFGFWIFASGSAKGVGGRGGWSLDDWMLDSLPAFRGEKDSTGFLLLWFPVVGGLNMVSSLSTKNESCFFKRVPSIKNPIRPDVWFEKRSCNLSSLSGKDFYTLLQKPLKKSTRIIGPKHPTMDLCQNWLQHANTPVFFHKHDQLIIWY